MNQYYLYRYERGLSVAEQRAADQRMGELAAALAHLRSSMAFSVGRGLGALRSLGRALRTREQAGVAGAAPTGR